MQIFSFNKIESSILNVEHIKKIKVNLTPVTNLSNKQKRAEQMYKRDTGWCAVCAIFFCLHKLGEKDSQNTYCLQRYNSALRKTIQVYLL